MQNRLLLIATFLIASFFSKAQYDSIQFVSGPSTWLSFDYSPGIAGTGWDSLSFDDSGWQTPYNGSGVQNSSTQCATANQSAWGSTDTIIWSSDITNAPDTACFRRHISIPKCGTVKASSMSIGADDYYFFYINGNFLGTNPVDGSGVVYTLTTQQLAWFHAGDNILAAEVINSAPSCGEFTMLGSIYVDTTGCLNTGINQISDIRMSISPNPAINYVNITMSDATTPYTFALYDVLGNKVITQMSSSAHTTINIGELSKGIYILQAINSKGKISTKKLSKE